MYSRDFLKTGRVKKDENMCKLHSNIYIYIQDVPKLLKNISITDSLEDILRQKSFTKMR